MITSTYYPTEANADPAYDQTDWPDGTVIYDSFITYAQQVVFHNDGDVATVNRLQKGILDEQAEIQEIVIGPASGGSYTITINGETTGKIQALTSTSQIQTAIGNLPAILALGTGLVTVTGTYSKYSVEFDNSLGPIDLATVETPGVVGEVLGDNYSSYVPTMGLDYFLLYHNPPGYGNIWTNGFQDFPFTYYIAPFQTVSGFTVVPNFGFPPSGAAYVAEPIVDLAGGSFPSIGFVKFVAGTNDTRPTSSTTTYYDLPEIFGGPNIEVGTVTTTNNIQLTADGFALEYDTTVSGSPPGDFDFQATESTSPPANSVYKALAEQAVANQIAAFRASPSTGNFIDFAIEEDYEIGFPTYASDVLFGARLSKASFQEKFLWSFSLVEAGVGNVYVKSVGGVLDFKIKTNTYLITETGGEQVYYIELPKPEKPTDDRSWTSGFRGDLNYPQQGIEHPNLSGAYPAEFLDYNSAFPTDDYTAMNS